MGSDQEKEDRADAVILVHGLRFGSWSLAHLRRGLARAGYLPRPFAYPTTRAGLRENAARLATFAASCAGAHVHFVGHSLGGLLILEALRRTSLRPGRVVLLASPVADCYAARRLSRSRTGRHMLGATMLDWLNRAEPASAMDRQVGVIAGNMSLGISQMLAPGIPRPHDGAVSVEETRLGDAADHIVLPVSHSGMLLSKPVMSQIVHFLRSGRFAH